MVIHPTVEIFLSRLKCAPTDRHCQTSSHAAIMAKNHNEETSMKKLVLMILTDSSKCEMHVAGMPVILFSFTELFSLLSEGSHHCKISTMEWGALLFPVLFNSLPVVNVFFIG